MILIDDVRAFQKVAALLGFSAAARVLGVRKSAISRSIQRLETAFHVRLLERTSRGVALTEAGAAMLGKFDDLLRGMDEAVDLAASLSGTPQGTLRITAGIGFGIEVLADILPDFSLRYPGIAVSLDLTSRTVDLIAERVDVAVRMGPLVDSGLTAIRLGAIGCQLCASPIYLARRGSPETVEALSDHELLSIPSPEGLPRRWCLRSTAGEERSVEAASRLSANDPHAIGRMVLSGAGIAAMANFVAAAGIDAGRLVRVLPDWSVPAVDVSVVVPGGRERSPAVAAFLSFLRERLAGSEWLDA